MRQLSIFVIIYFCLFITYCYGSANVHVNNSFIADESGRIRISHGCSFVSKELPWYPQKLLDPIFVENLSQWGINFVRLG